MVTVVNYESRTNKAGKEFNVLILQGGIEPVRSTITGKFYFSSRTCDVPASFDEMTCKNLIGTEFPGSIKRVPCEPYDFNIPNTEEYVNISHTWEYQDSIDEIVSEHIVETAAII
ncbi:hypothetical protein FF125_17380 [Aureibaculum algae]|uniref:Uncharacterized protein n=1 Tax=Aureibaculum algae TaxID=2584122 RepID=A0A5B7TXZ5_9FLAO|nr:hypothetical protein [Aureibaculum algae]QCX40131.1 hypothetical protein FF125_17380 [Aureibaculum algae]